MKARLVVVVAVALIMTVVQWSQGTAWLHAKQDRQAGTTGQSVRDTSSTESIESGDEETDQPAYVLKPWRALRGHLHNKIIHVPIGFAMSAFLLLLLALRRAEFQPAIRWLVLVAALGALAAYITGTSQAAVLEGGSRDWVIELHERLGIATAILLCAWAGSLWIRPLRKWAFLAGVVVMGLLVVTGFFGGVLAHG